MEILNILDRVDDVYAEPGFITLIESHLDYLKQFHLTEPLTLSEYLKQKYVGNLYALLVELRVDSRYHYVVMRLNDYENPSDFLGDRDTLLQPDYNEIELMRNIYMTNFG